MTGGKGTARCAAVEGAVGVLRRAMVWLAMLCALTGTARAAALLCVNAPGVVALTDNRGVEIIENGRFDSIFVVREDQLFAAGSRGAYRLYDAAGQSMGDVRFSMIDDTGYALLFRAGRLYGAMNAMGEVLVPAEWTQLSSDGSGGWLALNSDPLDEQPDEIIRIDAEGNQKQTGIYCSGGLGAVLGGRMVFMDGDGRFGALNAIGGLAVEPTWQYMGPYANGIAKVAGQEGMGVVDGSGRAVIAPYYPWLERSATMIAAWDGANVDIYGPQGGQRRVRLSGKVREVALAGDDLVVTYEGRTCLYDAYGRLITQDAGKVDYAPGSRGQLIACNGAWGEKCQWLVNPDGSKASGMFQQLLPLCAERYAFLEMAGETYDSEVLGRAQTDWNYGDCRYGLMDARGRILIRARYREIRALSSDRLLLIGDDRVQIADRNGVVMKTWITPESAESSAEANE